MDVKHLTISDLSLQRQLLKELLGHLEDRCVRSGPAVDEINEQIGKIEKEIGRQNAMSVIGKID